MPGVGILLSNGTGSEVIAEAVDIVSGGTYVVIGHTCCDGDSHRHHRHVVVGMLTCRSCC